MRQAPLAQSTATMLHTEAPGLDEGREDRHKCTAVSATILVPTCDRLLMLDRRWLGSGPKRRHLAKNFSLVLLDV